MSLFLFYEQISVSSPFKDVTAATITPALLGKATRVVLQADSGNIRYTMDGSNPAAGVGMRLLKDVVPPQEFDIGDFRAIKFISESGTAKLNVHYYGQNI